MEISEDLSQQERLHAIAEKRKRLTEIENKTRQLEDDKRKLQYLKAKALREQWLLDGMQSAGPEQDEANKQLQQSAANTKELEETIIRLKQELEELEVDVSAIPIKESLSDMTQEEVVKTADKKAPASSVEGNVLSVVINVQFINLISVRSDLHVQWKFCPHNVKLLYF